MGLCIIIPTFNEAQNPYYKRNLELLYTLKNIEVIISDGNSSDQTPELTKKFSFLFIENGGETRAHRINAGIAASKNNMLLILHPRNLITIEAIKAVQKISNEVVWGGLTHSFDNKGLFYRWTSWYSNNVRAKIKGIFYLDHCIFFHKSLLKNSEPPVPLIPIFEDTAFSLRLKKQLKPMLLKDRTITSALRFEKNGFLMQATKNQILKILYFFKFSGHSANAFYEKRMNLNNHYDK